MDLPKVFQNPNINLEKKNNNTNNKIKKENISHYDIYTKINKLFKSPNYIYKIKVLIKTKEDEKEEILIGKTPKYLLTINNEKILIKDILDINEKRQD